VWSGEGSLPTVGAEYEEEEIVGSSSKSTDGQF